MDGRNLLLASRNVMGRNSFSRHLQHAISCTHVTNSRSFHRPGLPLLRTASYSWKLSTLRGISPGFIRSFHWGFRRSPRNVEFTEGVSDCQEEAAKAAILDKVMKGRQVTDLMLRCELAFAKSDILSVAHPLIQGTVLDSQG